MTALARIGAGMAALAAAIPLWFGYSFTVLTLVVSWRHPDPSVGDGDPCCGHPDTWDEVASGTGFGALLGVATVGVAVGALTLGRYAVTGSLPSRRAIRWMAAGAAAAGGVLAWMTL